MKRKNSAHEIVLESITEALIQIMKEKPLSEINISELCKRAGVSRISFYRNYNSMNDILIEYLNKCTAEWWKEISKKTPEEFFYVFWAELSGQYRKNEDFIKLLYKNNASFIIKEHIFDCCEINSKCDDDMAYARSALAGAIYGFIEEWIRRGMKDLPYGFSLHKMLSVATGDKNES